MNSPIQLVPYKDNSKKLRKSRYSKWTNYLLAPLFDDLREHIVKTFVDNNIGTEAKMNYLIDKAIHDFDVKPKKKSKTKKMNYPFIKFVAAERKNACNELKNSLKRVPTQPEIVKYLGLRWNELKEADDKSLEIYYQLSS